VKLANRHPRQYKVKKNFKELGMTYVDKLYGTREQYAEFWTWMCSPINEDPNVNAKEFFDVCQYPSPANYTQGCESFVILNLVSKELEDYLKYHCPLVYVLTWLRKAEESSRKLGTYSGRLDTSIAH
jgi:hypothetical protein